MCRTVNLWSDKQKSYQAMIKDKFTQIYGSLLMIYSDRDS